MCRLKSYLSDPYKLLDLKTSQKRKDQRETTSLIHSLRRHSKTIINDVFSLKGTFMQSYMKSLCHYIDTNNTKKMKNKTFYANVNCT